MYVRHYWPDIQIGTSPDALPDCTDLPFLEYCRGYILAGR